MKTTEKTAPKVELTEETAEMISLYSEALDRLYRMEEIYLEDYCPRSPTCEELDRIAESLRDFLQDFLISRLAENNYLKL